MHHHPRTLLYKIGITLSILIMLSAIAICIACFLTPFIYLPLFFFGVALLIITDLSSHKLHTRKQQRIRQNEQTAAQKKIKDQQQAQAEAQAKIQSEKTRFDNMVFREATDESIIWALQYIRESGTGPILQQITEIAQLIHRIDDLIQSNSGQISYSRDAFLVANGEIIGNAIKILNAYKSKGAGSEFYKNAIAQTLSDNNTILEMADSRLEKINQELDATTRYRRGAGSTRLLMEVDNSISDMQISTHSDSESPFHKEESK